MNPWQLPEDELTEREKLILQMQGRAPAGALASGVEKMKSWFAPPSVAIPAPVKKGGGQAAKNQAKTDMAVRLVSTDQQPMSPEEFQSRYDLISKSPAIEAQRKGIDHLSRLMSIGLDQPAQTDLSPLIALSDTWFGGNLGKGYARPDASGRLEKAKAYAAKIQDDKNELAKTILSAMGKIQGAKVNEEFKGSSSQVAEATAKDPLSGAGGGKGATNADRFLRAYRSDPVVKPALEAVNGAKSILAAVGKNDWLNDVTLRASLVTAARLYPVSDRDVSQYGGSPDLPTRLERLVGRLSKGENFTESDRAVIQQYAQYALKKNAKAATDRAHDLSGTYAGTQGLSKETALGIALPAQGWEHVDEAAGATPAPRALTPAEKAELDALRKKAGR